MKVEIEVEVGPILEKLKNAPDKANQEITFALQRIGLLLLEKSLEITPRRYGDLRRSGTVPEPEISRNQIVQEVGFGGAAAPYAVFIHEIPDPLPSGRPVNWTTEGTGHKYLERPTLEIQDDIPELLQTQILDAFR